VISRNSARASTFGSVNNNKVDPNSNGNNGVTLGNKDKGNLSNA
jgi:hypothetical protein